METTRETIQTLDRDIFHAQLLSVYREFDVEENVHLSKEVVITELNKRKKKEDKLKKINKIPLIGKMMPRFIPSGGYCGSSDESKFILSIMNNLGIDYLDNKVVKFIWKYRQEFYEEFYREDYEKEHETRLKEFSSQSVEKEI